ncbi:MAG: RimK family alpha-L-glutamate ligase [Promethearchaeota archaeon]
MKIGILSKRTGHLTGKLKRFFETQGHSIRIYTKKELQLDKTLLENDLYILKSKTIFFIYAGFYAEANNIPVIPKPDISRKHKDRLEAHLLIKNAGLLYPEFYYGTFKTMKDMLKKFHFPLILKPIVGSGSKGVKKINKIEDIDMENDELIYLERFIEGVHYLAYFIENEICVLEKPPLSNEHVPMKEISLFDDVREVVIKWKNYYNLLFGHLDIVREYSTGKLYVVDPGSFPEFTNWKCNADPVSKIGNLILKEYKKLKN